MQARTGEERIAQRNGTVITDRIPNGALLFVDKQPMALVSSLDPTGRVWVSLLAGKPGFLQAKSPSLLHLNGALVVSEQDDILWSNIQQQPQVGMVLIELASRRRLRVNGELQATGPDTWDLTVGEAYPNCPKYIQRREIEVEDVGGLPEAPITTGDRLDEELRTWIVGADTFFVGSSSADQRLDASHRGGSPGFVVVEDAQTLLIPDYIGNSMYNTLGNLLVNPACGLLFVDFQTGQTLQLTGQAEVLFDQPGTDAPTGGTHRLWRFHLTAWRRQASLRRVAWRFVDYSPFNV